jgi:hypothetical protein
MLFIIDGGWRGAGDVMCDMLLCVLRVLCIDGEVGGKRRAEGATVDIFKGKTICDSCFVWPPYRAISSPALADA